MARDYYDYVTETGVIIPDTAEVKEEIEEQFKETFGSDLDVSPQTPQGRMIEMRTMERVFVIGLCAYIANQININYAFGEFLDAIGALFGVERIGATQTRVLATLTGTPNTVIPQGSLAKTIDGKMFYLENETTIGSSGNTTSYFLAQDFGEVSCNVGELNTIVSQIIGWEVITNNATAILGSEAESDFNFRKRIENARYVGIGMLADIKAGLNNIPTVKSSFVYDNGENTSVVYDTVTIPAHSMLVVVDGGTNQEVAEAIFKNKSAGCGYTAITGQSVTEQVRDGAYGVAYNVTFNRPALVDFDIKIQVRRNDYTGLDVEGAVKMAIINWAQGNVEGVDGLRIGQNISPFEIASAVSAELPPLYVKSCLICNHGGTPASAELTYHINQIGNIQESNITVEVVD